MNKKFYEKQLADLKRANKTRKLKLAIDNGYVSIEMYKEALESALFKPETTLLVETKDVVLKEKPKIHNVVILDNSGSMAGAKFINAYNGIKDESKKLKESVEIEYTQTFCHFSEGNGPSEPVVTHRNTPIGEFEVPDIGVNAMTPLYLSIIKVCTELIAYNDPKNKVLIQIFTDGKNNAGNGNRNRAKELISDCKSLGMTVTFIATKEDMFNIINNLGVDESDTLVHDNTPKGIEAAFETRSKSLGEYSSKVIKGEDVSSGFYKTL